MEYRNALAHQPDAAETHYKLGKVYDQLGELDKAFTAFRRVTQLDHGNVDAHLRVASTLLDVRRFDEAERLVERVIAREPRNVRALISSRGRWKVSVGERGGGKAAGRSARDRPPVSGRACRTRVVDVARRAVGAGARDIREGH